MSDHESHNRRAQHLPADGKSLNSPGTAVSEESGARVTAEPAATAMELDLLEWPIVESRRYELEGEHARGGLGRIVLASDRRLDRVVAVKELLQDSRHSEARFIREALITARLPHPAIVPVYDVARWPSGKPFYSMKMVSGQSLGEALKDRKTLSERLPLLPNLIAVADAVAYAHKQRIVHRDLKPSNVLIGPFGETMVIDWGLAMDLSQSEQPLKEATTAYDVVTVGLTVAGTVMGTPEYMPPEQAAGSPVDERADVYSLGAILYHLLAGTPPHTGGSSSEVLAKVTSEAPIPVEQRETGVPRDLAAIVRKAMAGDAKERYPSAKELSEELEISESWNSVRTGARLPRVGQMARFASPRSPPSRQGS